jgi:hypothetical protein
LLVNVVGDRIYYVGTGDNQFYSINTDGTDRRLVSDETYTRNDETWFGQTADEWETDNRTLVSADTQLVDSLRTAMIIGLADPNNDIQHVIEFTSAITTSDNSTVSLASLLPAPASGPNTVAADIADALQLNLDNPTGASIQSALLDQMRSNPRATDIQVCLINGNIIVVLPDTDRTGDGFPVPPGGRGPNNDGSSWIKVGEN